MKLDLAIEIGMFGILAVATCMAPSVGYGMITAGAALWFLWHVKNELTKKGE